jgi:hypothetical protein
MTNSPSQQTNLYCIVDLFDQAHLTYSGSRLIGSLWDSDSNNRLILISGSASTYIMYERVIRALSS